MKLVSVETAKRLGVDYVELPSGKAAIGDSVKVPRFAGIGDVVESVFKATGIAKAAKAYERATGKPCNCSRRKEALNRLLPF